VNHFKFCRDQGDGRREQTCSQYIIKEGEKREELLELEDDAL
jgi:hypothetical protein